MSDDDSFKQFKGSDSDSKSDPEIIDLDEILISNCQNSQHDEKSEKIEAEEKISSNLHEPSKFDHQDLTSETHKNNQQKINSENQD